MNTYEVRVVFRIPAASAEAAEEFVTSILGRDSEANPALYVDDISVVN